MEHAAASVTIVDGDVPVQFDLFGYGPIGASDILAAPIAKFIALIVAMTSGLAVVAVALTQSSPVDWDYSVDTPAPTATSGTGLRPTG